MPTLRGHKRKVYLSPLRALYFIPAGTLVEKSRLIKRRVFP